MSSNVAPSRAIFEKDDSLGLAEDIMSGEVKGAAEDFRLIPSEPSPVALVLSAVSKDCVRADSLFLDADAALLGDFLRPSSSLEG